MGKGKGEPEYWVAVVKPGTAMFEVAGVDELTAKKCLARSCAQDVRAVPVR